LTEKQKAEKQQPIRTRAGSRHFDFLYYLLPARVLITAFPLSASVLSKSRNSRNLILVLNQDKTKTRNWKLISRQEIIIKTKIS